MKIDLPTEILKHKDEEVVEFLVEQLKGVTQVYATHTDSAQLETCATNIGLAYNVLKEMNKRNKSKNGQDNTVVL